jgi:hypothetical protein
MSGFGMPEDKIRLYGNGFSITTTVDISSDRLVALAT